MSIENSFKPGFRIERSISTGNGMGGYTLSWSNHLDISGFIDLIGNKKDEIASRFQATATDIFLCKAGYDITESDRLIYKNKIYRILFIDEPRNHHAEILLEYVGVDNG